MSKLKKIGVQKGSNDGRRAVKAARTASNKAKRQARHAERTAQQSACPKRGLARSLRRWVDRSSREPAAVLTKHKNLASIHRVAASDKKRKVERPLGLSINGQPMGSVTEAVWTIRNLAEERKQQATIPA